jgi:hypothetical protein
MYALLDLGENCSSSIEEGRWRDNYGNKNQKET